MFFLILHEITLRIIYRIDKFFGHLRVFAIPIQTAYYAVPRRL